jgi:sugar/nucleoside kinase (ribokinase family)
MLNIGFDPAFIDTLVRVQTNNGVLEKHLPPPGYHHRSSNITRIAGGNGTNIASILIKLNVQCTLVVPTDPYFEILLKQRGIKNIVSIKADVNETVGVSWKPGEIQFNSIRGRLGRKHWTEVIHNLWSKSKIQLYLNWGLNPDAKEWVACQWLASCGWNFQELSAEKNIESQAIEATTINKPIILEPGSFESQPQKQFLLDILKKIGTTSFDEIYPILSCNEEESKEYQKMNFPTKIIHTSTEVVEKRNDHPEYHTVEPLEHDPITYVGAGDSFLAGLIEGVLNYSSLDIEHAITVAQQFLTGKL